LRTSARIIITACSETVMLFEKVTSATVMPFSIAASMSTWSEPIPAVTASLSLGPFCDPLRVR
jgi:hypothetical protein